MGFENNGRVAADHRSITHRAAFRFKWEDGRERFFVTFCCGMARRRGEVLSLDFHTLLRTGISVESAAPNHPEVSGRNVFEPARDKLIGSESHQFLRAIPVIARPERDFGLCRRVDPAVGNRSTGHVAGEISGDGNSVRISLLNSHVPGQSTEPIQQRLHTGDRHRFGNHDLTAMDGRFQRVTEFSSKDRRELE